jgi:hypothetical protein
MKCKKSLHVRKPRKVRQNEAKKYTKENVKDHNKNTKTVN